MRLERLLARLIAGFLLAAAVISLTAPPALAKSFAIDEVDIRATVLSDGSMRVSETRTFNFKGDFSRVYWDLKKKPEQELEILAVAGPPHETAYKRVGPPFTAADRPPGMYDVSPGSSNAHVDVFFQGAGKLTFKLDYVVMGAATRWADTGELYWQFVGSGWEEGARSVHAEVLMPPGVTTDTLKVWAHGPLNGSVGIEPGDADAAASATSAKIVADVKDVPARTFVELRAAFPEAALEQAPIERTNNLPIILGEEKAWADEANAKRSTARLLVGGSWAVALLAGVFSIAWAIWAYLRHGRDHKIEFKGEYFRDIPSDLPPAMVGALMRWGMVTRADLSATLLGMADDGIITLEPVTQQVAGPAGAGARDEQTYRMTLNREKAGSANDVAAMLSRFIFATGDSITLLELKARAESDPVGYGTGLRDWYDVTSTRAEKRGWFETRATGWIIGMYLVAFVSTGVGVVCSLVAFNILLMVPALAGAGTLVFLAPKMGRLSAEGAELHAKYKALERFLRDFSRLHEAPPASVILWNKFLVLAVVFGIAKEVIKQLKTTMPHILQDPDFALTYWWLESAGRDNSSPSDALSSTFDALTSSFATATSVADSDMSSDIGSGGGFSDGGGGGGGGGAD
ncbi:MAG: DUF2207 domain-containing protein [Actinomycetota bacterium]|nr:DUF2207 domain-containing protein [Actinomycetota bacterium]